MGFSTTCTALSSAFPVCDFVLVSSKHDKLFASQLSTSQCRRLFHSPIRSPLFTPHDSLTHSRTHAPNLPCPSIQTRNAFSMLPPPLPSIHCRASNHRKSYNVFFEWFHGRYVDFVIEVAAEFFDVPAVTTPLLRFWEELVRNKARVRRVCAVVLCRACVSDCVCMGACAVCAVHRVCRVCRAMCVCVPWERVCAVVPCLVCVCMSDCVCMGVCAVCAVRCVLLPCDGHLVFSFAVVLTSSLLPPLPLSLTRTDGSARASSLTTRLQTGFCCSRRPLSSSAPTASG